MKNIYSTFFIFFIVTVISPLVVLVNADWPVYQANPHHMGSDDSEKDLYPPLILKYMLPQVVNASLVASEEKIFAKNSSGVLFAIDSNSGIIDWQVQTESGGELAYANNIVYTNSGNTVVAYNSLSGQLIWSAPFLAYTLTVDENVVFVANDRTLVALDANSGVPIWSRSLDDSIFQTPAIIDGKIYIGTYQRSLYALDAKNGAILWQRENLGCWVASPTVVNNIVYAGDQCGGWLYAFDASSGANVWRVILNHGTPSGSSFSNNLVYTQSGGIAYAFNSQTGSQVWSHNGDTNIGDQAPPVIVINGVAYQGSIK